MTLLDIPISLYSCVFVCVSLLFRLYSLFASASIKKFDFWLKDKWLKMYELRLFISR